MTTLEQSKELLEKLKSLPPADWVGEMLEYYQRTGSFRTKDLRRLFGSQKRNDMLRSTVFDIIHSKSR